MSDHPRPHPDLAGYVLGVLEPQEAVAFEEHLAFCPACRREVAALSTIPSLLDDAAPPTRVPPTLQHRTLTAVERSAIRRRRTRAAATTLAAVAAVALVAILVVQPFAAEPFKVQLASATTDASGAAYVSRTPNGLRIDMELRDLPATPEGMHYECWYVAETDSLSSPQRVTGGTFVAPSGGDVEITMFTAADAEDYPGIDITLEPDDGDPARDGEVVLASEW